MKIEQIPLELSRKESGNTGGPPKGGMMPSFWNLDQLSSLPHLQKPALFTLWQQLFNTIPPNGMRKEMLVQFLAYRMQEKELGGVSDRSHLRLKELAGSIEARSTTSASSSLVIKPGTRLMREWKEQVHVVNVEEGSYEYRGARYESLSEIARLITGTRWSGPLFFGLKGKRNSNSMGAA
jgi:hypothetical protein